MSWYWNQHLVSEVGSLHLFTVDTTVPALLLEGAICVMRLFEANLRVF